MIEYAWFVNEVKVSVTFRALGDAYEFFVQGAVLMQRTLWPGAMWVPVTDNA